MAADNGKLDLVLEENRRLRRAVEELTVLNDLAREIGSSLNSQHVMNHILKRSLHAVKAEQGNITLIDSTAKSQHTLIRAMHSTADQPAYHLGENLTGWVLINKRSLIVNNPAEDERFSGVSWPSDIHSVLCVPLIVKSELIGILTVYNRKRDKGFNDDDERLLGIIASQSAQIIENARLYEEERKHQQVKEDLRMAARIQKQLLPKYPPEIEGYDIAGAYEAAQMVGGDYYDYIKTDVMDVAIGLGDVAGKGLAAALLMAHLQATIRGQTLVAATCKEVMDHSTKLLYRSTNLEKYATFFFCAFEKKKDSLHYANAGHNPALLFHGEGSDPELLRTGGIPLGVMEEFEYAEDTVPFKTGDVLVIFSDGITEAMNEDEEEFGLARLIDVVGDKRQLSCADIITAILSAVQKHTRSADQHDDITIVIVKRI